MPRNLFNVGNLPPQILWTIVRGDSAVFRVYVTDDNRQPLDINGWDITIDIERSGQIVQTLLPQADPDEELGYFFVRLTPSQSELLETDDIFDIQLWDRVTDDSKAIVWTVAQGKMNVIEDVTAGPMLNPNGGES